MWYICDDGEKYICDMQCDEWRLFEWEMSETKCRDILVTIMLLFGYGKGNGKKIHLVP